MKTIILTSLLCAGALTLHAAVTPQKPNIVLIFTDDLGYGDLACYGNPRIKTQNIDRLAAEGQRWTSFYSAASCVPSRTGLMSGRHPALLRDQPLRADPKALMPAMLKRQGYATAILGKWHLADIQNFTKDAMHPLECGFDEHFGTPGSHDGPAPLGKKLNRELFDMADKFTFQVPLIRGREVVELPMNAELITQRYTQEAVAFIQRQTANRDLRTAKPFFLYLAHNMPHVPVFASPKFQGKSAGGRYGDVIEEIDWSVGEVMKAIKDAGIDEQTLIIFTSDNGPWTVFGPHGGTAAPLRGEKATTWEGGVRVPAIFRWPGKIAPAVVDGIAANLDLYATFAALAGGNVPAEKPGFISQDLSGALLRGTPSPRTQFLCGISAFRSGKYKIHTVTSLPTDPVNRAKTPITRHDPPLLFDLEADIGEQHDLSAEKPEIVERLLKEMKTWLTKPG